MIHGTGVCFAGAKGELCGVAPAGSGTGRVGVCSHTGRPDLRHIRCLEKADNVRAGKCLHLGTLSGVIYHI